MFSNGIVKNVGWSVEAQKSTNDSSCSSWTAPKTQPFTFHILKITQNDEKSVNFLPYSSETLIGIAKTQTISEKFMLKMKLR